MRGCACLNVRYKRLLLALVSAALAAVMSGCFVKTVDELYTLPTHSDEYYDLQNAIDAVFDAGSLSYSAPVAGENQQSVQLADIDGDGEDEAIAYLRSAGERPLCAYIFDQIDGSYVNTAVIEGSGSAFESVAYAQLDGEGGVEIIIGRQLSDQVLQTISAYAVQDGRVVELMSANYSEYTLADLDGDGCADIFVLRHDAASRKGVAELYRWRNGQIEREQEASLSSGVEAIKRIITGSLSQNIPAAFVAGLYESDSIVTDVFAFRDGVFQNISAQDADFSVQTARNYFVYAADIDADGVIELPQVITLPVAGENGEVYPIIRWFQLSLGGGQTVKMTTYHSFSGGWFLRLPEEWNEQITISRSAEADGVRGLVFSHWDEETKTAEPIVTIYAFSGEMRNQTAALDGRLILAEKGDVTYAAKLGTSALAAQLDHDRLRQLFHFIHIDWNSGER